MVEVVCAAPCHASCHDRPPGHMGSPLAPGRPRSGPDQRGLSASPGYLHPDGRSPRGHHPAHQTGECRRVRSTDGDKNGISEEECACFVLSEIIFELLRRCRRRCCCYDTRRWFTGSNKINFQHTSRRLNGFMCLLCVLNFRCCLCESRGLLS